MDSGGTSREAATHRAHPIGPPLIPYASGLDGLRALAVLPVMAYHALLPSWSGGFLGVEVFFVISGYLITSLLLAEFTVEGNISLKDFWMRRARRLLPALYLVLATVVVTAVLVVADARTRLGSEVAAALTYSTNWYQIYRDLSYFEFIGRPPLLNHLWSLAVEEQFYLLWPLVLLRLLRRFGRGPTLLLVLVGAGVSTWLTAHLYTPGMLDPSSIYLRTDTRAAGLLIGAALAFIWSPWTSQRSKANPLLDLSALVSLCALVWFYRNVNDFDPFVYEGGFAMVSLVTAVIIAAAVHPRGRIADLLAIAPLRYIGRRSYGLYLWHWPVFQVTRPHSDIPISGTANLALRFTLTFAIAEVSYRYIERPVREGVIGRQLAAARAASGRERRMLRRRTLIWAAMLGVSISTLLAAVVLAKAPEQSGVATAATVSGESTTTESQAVASKTEPVALAIGDSVMDRSRDAIAELVPELTVDARGNRVWTDTISILERHRAAGTLPEIVLIHLGTNGPFSASDVDATLSILEDADHVIVFTAKVPRPYESIVNRRIVDGASRYENVTVVDWHTMGNANPHWFTHDQVHLGAAGKVEYARIIRAAIDATHAAV